MIGVGNVVGIVTAIQLGGPGALLWVWVAGFAGTLIKYSEIYLGLKHRILNERQSYDGGPMFFLQKAFGIKGISVVVCILLCIYGAEIYQFNVVVDTLSYSWGLNRFIIVLCLLGLILYATLGGVSRVARVCSCIMPVFICIHISMCLWVIGYHNFPMMDYLMPMFIFILGYSTLIAYLIVGIKCARFLYPSKGVPCYICYTICVMVFFAFFDQSIALLVMRIAGALLLMLNLAGIYCLRHEIVFALDEETSESALTPPSMTQIAPLGLNK